MSFKRVRIQSIFKRDTHVADYHENGQLSRNLHYRYGRLHGTLEVFHENGQLNYKATYNMGKADGLFESFFDNGHCEKRHTFINGEMEGLAECYYVNGKSKYKTEYSNGELDGTSVWHHENGHLWYKNNFKDGLEHGLHEAFHENGQLAESIGYIFGAPDGPYEVFYADGQLKLQQQFNHGLVDGLKFSYYPNGNICAKEKYNNGLAQGLSETYDDLGKLTSQSNFKDGIRQLTTSGDDRTAACEHSPDDNSSANSFHFFINKLKLQAMSLGLISKIEYFTGTLKNGLYEGYGVLQFKNDERYEGHFHKGEYHGEGEWIAAANSRNPGSSYKGTWNMGKRDGEGVDIQGCQVISGRFLNDKPHGYAEVILPNGDQYVGFFEHGKKEGQGAYTFKSGRIDKGLYKNNRFLGEAEN